MPEGDAWRAGELRKRLQIPYGFELALCGPYRVSPCQGQLLCYKPAASCPALSTHALDTQACYGALLPSSDGPRKPV